MRLGNIAALGYTIMKSEKHEAEVMYSTRVDIALTQNGIVYFHPNINTMYI